MGPCAPNPAKMLVRKDISAKIAALTSDEKKRQSQIIYEKVINHPWYKSAKRIALYMSTDQEVDTSPIVSHILGRGASAFVPQYAGGHMKMLKMLDGDEENMIITKDGIAQHGRSQARDDALDCGGLDLIIAPGLAFTNSGLRLGHGGGYYDKYLEKVRGNPTNKTKVIALAFNCQICSDIPVEDVDQKMDEVIVAV